MHRRRQRQKRKENFAILRELITMMKNGDGTSMILRKFAFGLVMAGMLGAAGWAQTAPGGRGAAAGGKGVLTVDDYFRLKEVADPQISPDAKWVAYVVKTAKLKEDKNNERIWMVAAGGGTAIPLTAEKGSSSHPGGSPDRKYPAFLSAREGGGGEDEEEGKA